jgi:hypothetical protein
MLRVKGNQKTLHTRLKALPWAQVPEAARLHSVGHGRVESRTIRVIDLAGSSDGHGEFFPDAAQALKIIRRRRDRHGRWSVETVYAITSLTARQAEPALLACWVRGHWGIEAGLHRVRDVVFGEDHSQVRRAPGLDNVRVRRLQHGAPARWSRRRTNRRFALTRAGEEHPSRRSDPQRILQRLGEGAGQDRRSSSPRCCLCLGPGWERGRRPRPNGLVHRGDSPVIEA